MLRCVLLFSAMGGERSGTTSAHPMSGNSNYVNRDASRSDPEGRAGALLCELIVLPIFNNGPNNRCQQRLNCWAYVPPGRIIGPNIVSTGLRFKTPKDSELPLPSMLRLFEHIMLR